MKRLLLILPMLLFAFSVEAKSNRGELGSSGDVYTKVDYMPTFASRHLSTFGSWVLMKLENPKYTLSKDVQGRIYAIFIIEEDGSVLEVKVSESPDRRISKDMESILKSAVFSPATIDGKPVKFLTAIALDVKTQTTTTLKVNRNTQYDRKYRLRSEGDWRQVHKLSAINWRHYGMRRDPYEDFISPALARTTTETKTVIRGVVSF